MARRSSVRGRLAAAGLEVEAAVQRLTEAGLWDEDDPGTETLDDLLDLVSTTAAPGDALATLTEIAHDHPDLFRRLRDDQAWALRVAKVAGTSRPLGRLLAQYPGATEALERVWPVDPGDIAASVEAAVEAAIPGQAQAAAIADVRRRATADIAARDLTGVVSVDEVAAELAALAEGVLSGTLAAVQREIAGEEPTARISVVGMGKLGGFELNYVSDVDVIFVHAAVDGADDEAAASEARQTLQRLLELCNASTTMGRAYEVDPTLRPEGRTGPLSRTVDSYVAYWERWAKTWEFQALLKARPVAGDRILGAELLQRAEPFVWPEELDPAVVAEIREMKGRVEAKPEVRRHGERQVKLGPGGLRDIEFAVQLLQLVHGRGDHLLRLTGTLPALAALARGGYIADEDAETFGQAYRTLRTVEHRLQLAHERRTHTIPESPERQEWLARSLGYRPDGDRPARVAFMRDLTAVQADVRGLHAKLFYRPLLEAHASVPAQAAGVALPDMIRSMGEQQAHERLRLLGFGDAPAALRHVRALTAGVTRQARTLRAVLPAMLHALADTPDPDTGLRMLRTVLEHGGASAELVPHLRDHPPAAALLARVLGTSEVAGELLVANPQGIEWLLEADSRATPRSRDDAVRLAMNRLGWQDTTAALRRLKRHELLRIVLRDLDGSASVTTVGEELTALAEASLEGALSAVIDDLRHAGEMAPVRFAIIGLGKLGGRELNYVSDLDVIFVHELLAAADDPPAASNAALVLAERVVSALGTITAEGTAFEVDPDLRPEGRSGPLSRSLSAMETYYHRWAEPWEHHALMKARVVAGDRELGEKFCELVRPLAFPEDLGEQRVQQMRQMKARIERERIGRTDPKRHLKLGPGGISDVEWTVQVLQRQHGHDAALVQEPGTMAALDLLQDASLIGHDDATWLRDAYRLYARVRNHLYLLRERNVDVLPKAPATYEKLARALGYGRGGRQDLEADLKRHQRHVRHITERLFYGVSEPLARDRPTWGRQ